MKPTLIFHLLAAASCAMAAWPATAQQVDVAGSEIAFVTRQMGVPVEGRFQRFSAQVTLDPRKLEASQVTLRIQIDSISFAAPEVATEAQRAVWFDTARRPQALFQSSAMRALGGGRYEMRGRLTLKDQTRDITVPVTTTQSGTTGTASGSFTLKRNEFGIGSGEWADASLVAHEVEVRFRFALTGLMPP